MYATAQQAAILRAAVERCSHFASPAESRAHRGGVGRARRLSEPESAGAEACGRGRSTTVVPRSQQRRHAEASALYRQVKAIGAVLG
jgi:hypothetical protein